MERSGCRKRERSQAESAFRPAFYEKTLQELQQENDSLKQLVVQLSQLVMKQVAGQR
jgi:hypothetical protein|uniref:Uncharacterized protein n=1 Tax=Rhodopseudomonas palustris (strain BisA53) TaxID=316055 RepID=Q07IB8_RHOP5